MSMARIFAHGAMTAEQTIDVCRKHGLELVQNAETGNFSMQQKREEAIKYLRQRGKYVLDQGSKKPLWGNGSPPEAA